MGGKIVGWAFKQKCRSATQKLVLAKIAENANEQGECFPSVKRIATEVQLTPRTVRRALHELAIDGFVSIAPRFNHKGQTSNLYLLTIPVSGNLKSKHSGTSRGTTASAPPITIYSEGLEQLKGAPHSLQAAVHINSSEPPMNLPPINGCDTPAMKARVAAFRNAIGLPHFEAWFKDADFREGPPVTIQFAGKVALSIAPARFRKKLESYFGEDFIVTLSVTPNAVGSLTKKGAY